MDLWSAPVQLLAEQLPPTGGASLMNRWGYAQSYACRQMAKPSKGLLLPQQFPNLLHSSLPNLLSQPISTANLPQGEVPSNPSLLQMGGRRDRIAAEKDPQVNKSLPTTQGWRICVWLAVCSFFARTFESDSLSREPKGQKTSCPPNHGLVSLQGFTFICKVILLPYPPMETKKS